MSQERSERSAVVLGLLAPGGAPGEIAGELAEDLPDKLRDRYDGAEWHVETAEAQRAEASASVDDLLKGARERLLRESWSLVVGLTDLPLRSGRRPVTTHANASHGVGLVSVPALGAVHVEKRAQAAVLNVVDGLLGESAGDGSDADDDSREKRMHGRIRELASPREREDAERHGTARFGTITLASNLRLLIGMVRANQPARVVARLSRTTAAACGTAAYALTSSSFWMLADGMTAPRLAGLGLATVLAMCVILVLAHGLWERAPSPEARERTMLFNLTTAITLLLAVVTLYLALAVVTGVAAALLIPADVFKTNVGHAAGLPEYVRLAFLGAAIATLAGALGSLLESDASVREAAYRSHADERTEAQTRG